nr:PREDICTED: uncharacterized protein LOC108195314 isoform X2 [Daucus carota subsp. sativus]
MTMFPPTATSTTHHHQNFSSYTGENRCYVNANSTSSYGVYLNQSIFGAHSLLEEEVQGEEGYDNFCSKIISGDPHQTAYLVGSAYSDQVMGEEDESKTETAEMSKTNDRHGEEAAGSSSKDLIKDINPLEDEQGGGGWLQLSIGSHREPTTGSSSDYQYHDDDNKLVQTRGVELDLLANSSSMVNTEAKTSNFTQESAVLMNRSSAAAAASSSTQQQQQQQQQQYYYSPVLPPRPNNLFLQHYYPPPTTTSPHYPFNPNYHNQQDVGTYQEYNTNHQYWPAFRSSSSSSSSLLPPGASYLSRLPFQLHGTAAASGGDFAHHLPRFDFRVVDPPRRPHSGIWFTLQASHIQAKEPFLPQIPKSYLRIKQMTIRLIIKYLVNKLRLDSEAEIEIRCKGQQLMPYLTLQHVRDSIWNPRDSSSFSSSDQLQHHLMVLHYGRTSA